MRITLCARSKILQLVGVDEAFRIQVTEKAAAGTHIDLIPGAIVTEGDNTISIIPLVVADIQTVTLLAGQDIDFDYSTDEFIISNRGNE